MKEISEDIFNAEITDLEELLALVDDAFEDLDSIPGFFYEDDEDEDKDEEDEYESGTLNEEIRRYHQEFRKYIKKIKDGLEKLGYKTRGNEESQKSVYAKSEKNKKLGENFEKEEVDPFERGHKWGCGCPACSAFREHFYSSGMSVEDLSIPDTLTVEEVKSQIEKNTTEHKDSPEDYPCSGKLRGLFHNRDGFLKYVMDGFGNKRGIMNYLAV